ncbi:hypothetical protein F5Y11DRAFT_345065 [Daldinia sp. FL1419]|nr:hypothetical protein F5Y11DRAFT_345065 [Daldinia sp. FL1419]
MSNESHVQFPDLERPATTAPPWQQQEQQEQREYQDNHGRRRSSSDPTGQGRKRPGLAVIPPRRGTNGSRMPPIPEQSRPTSTALFHTPRGRTELDQNIADLLDVIDPEVSTFNNVTNIQNSLFVPSLGRFINRRPTYQLSIAPEHGPIREEKSKEEGFNFEHAVLPDGVFLDGWTDEEKDELNDYVRHMLHSRRSRFKRSMKAFGQYVRKPLGFLVTLYATLITLFGLAWVLFLIGWIYVGEEQVYAINVIDYVLVALFNLVGDGLAPFRAIDTYHMAYIAHYHRLTWKLRQKKRMGKLRDKNDLPTNADLEAARDELSVLTPQQEARLVYHQTKFAKSHTFYKPHETKTHYAFPLNWLVAIVTLLDIHSCLQIALGATTYGIDYHVRPMAITATILSCSIAVNITAGILISIGGRRTRKKDVVERMFRQDLTREAFDKIRARGKKHGDTEKQLKAERALEQGRQSEANDDAASEEIRGIPIEHTKTEDEQKIYPDTR